MDWRSFIGSIVNSIAWPAAVVIAILLLRRALTRVLQNLSKLKWKDLEIEVTREIAQAEAEAAEGEPLRKLPAPRLPQGSLLYLRSLAEVSPRAAILEGWLPFEITASRVAEDKGIMKAGSPIQMPALIDGLKREGVLTDGEAKALGRLRAIRNKVVHATEEVQPADAAEYATLLHQITTNMQKRAAGTK